MQFSALRELACGLTPLDILKHVRPTTSLPSLGIESAIRSSQLIKMSECPGSHIGTVYEIGLKLHCLGFVFSYKFFIQRHFNECVLIP